MKRSQFPAGLRPVLLSLVLTCGCTQGPNDASKSVPSENGGTGEKASTASTTPDQSDVQEIGGEFAVLEGRVAYQGSVPPPRKISVTKDVEYCGQFVSERQDVLVSESGGLANVIVEVIGIKEPENGWNWPRPEDGYVLRQKGCAFEPPLLVMPDGESLQIFNDDRVAHNINTGQWNVMHPEGADPLTRSLDGRLPVRVGCNIHSWMEGWIYLVRSPFYAVTNEEGDYRIEDVPPGKYRVVGWHSSLQRKRASIEFRAGQAVRQEFVFESPVQN